MYQAAIFYLFADIGQWKEWIGRMIVVCREETVMMKNEFRRNFLT